MEIPIGLFIILFLSLNKSKSLIKKSIPAYITNFNSNRCLNKPVRHDIFSSDTANEVQSESVPQANSEVSVITAPPVEITNEETYSFKAEVNKVMDIIVNSLYTDKDVFLRELVSNAADALDKRRLGASGESKPDVPGSIRIKPDKVLNTLTIEDDGIGMSRADLINNIGTIAESGTAKFLKQIETDGFDSNLIGQFGVGFYSAFLVANQVDIYTKPYNDPNSPIHKWSSNSNGTYTVAEHKGGDVDKVLELGGTRIVLHLRPECDEYLEDYKLKDLLRKYSEFVKYPIQVWVEKVDYDRVPDEQSAIEGKPMRYKTVTRKRNEWEVVNTQLPIWRRDESQLKPEDYIAFYKSTFKAYDDPMSYIHFKVEGQVAFSSIIYVPGALPWELSRNMFDDQSRAIRLYVKRVFINDKFAESIPRWLTFVRGVVDSDDLPLNVGREHLQKSRMLTIINKRLATKAIEMLRNLRANSTPEKWHRFNDHFGKYLKVGMVEDQDNQQALASLVQFWSNKSNTTRVGLDEYIDTMKEGQKYIYYLTAEDKKTAENSPCLEKLNKLGYQVLFALEPVDEFCLSALAINKYKDITLIDVGKADLSLPEEEAATPAKEGEKTEFETLCAWFKDLLVDRVNEVRISNRLTDSPAVLVQSEYGLSPSMRKYMKQQATAQGMQEEDMISNALMTKPVLEINTQHPIIKHLNQLVKEDKLGQRPRDIALQLFDVVSILGGYTINEPSVFAKRVLNLMLTSIEGGSTTSYNGDPEIPDETSE